MKRIKLYEEFLNEANNMRTLRGFLKELKKEYGPTPTEQSLADFIYNNYEEVTGEELEDSDPASNDHIADIIAHFKMDGEDFMIAWEDRTNESVLCEATVQMDAMDPEDKDFLKFLKKHKVEIIDTIKSGPSGHPEITMQGKRKDLEKVLADSEFGWDDPDLAEYIEESLVQEAATPKDSKVDVDDFTTDAGTKIKATEIVGAMVSHETEEEFKQYFYDEYGMTAFTEADMGTLANYFNEYLEEIKAKETEEEEKEKEAEEGGDEKDPLAGLDI